MGGIGIPFNSKREVLRGIPAIGLVWRPDKLVELTREHFDDVCALVTLANMLSFFFRRL